MGILVEQTGKTILGIFDEAWRTEIEGAPNTDPKVTCHRQEVAYYDDGSYGVVPPARTSPGFVKRVVFTMGEVAAREDELAYTDGNGDTKLIPAADVPFIAKALIDLMGEEARERHSDRIVALAEAGEGSAI